MKSKQPSAAAQHQSRDLLRATPDTRPRRTFCWGGRDHQPLQMPVFDGEVRCTRGCPPRPVRDLDNVELCEPDGDNLAAEVRMVSALIRSSKPEVADTLDAALLRAGWLP